MGSIDVFGMNFEFNLSDHHEKKLNSMVGFTATLILMLLSLAVLVYEGIFMFSYTTLSLNEIQIKRSGNDFVFPRANTDTDQTL